ncbi:MAG: type I-E CRISPR-associated protein Cse1/CasA [Micrococcales bacterium]|nr:type I-E CRISPR-associated protein Cse1/CasA [Micrococcales bacterium]
MTDGFNLLEQPWIRVRSDEGLGELSLRETLTRAHEMTALAGEVPTQDAAVLRVLLAVLYRSLAEEPGKPTAVWRGLWEAPTLPVDLIGEYLASVQDRFDLFDSEAPFFQAAGITANKTSGLVKLIADVPDGHRYFATRAGSELQSLSCAEAGRWLVHAQAFEPSGIKTGLRGDPRVKGGRGYPIGTGWSGRCGLIILEGATLKETLLLNLVLGLNESDAAADLPVWERPPLGPTVERRHPEPRGPADIMTWPARRVLLTREGDRVVDVLLGNGDPIHARNRQDLEMMTAWRHSRNQEKLHGGTVYMPRQHDPGRALWRGLAGILVDRPQSGAVANQVAPQLPPGNVVWLARLREAGAIEDAHPIRVHAVGVAYGTQDASIDSVYDDSLVMRVAVASDPVLRATALQAAAEAELAARQVADLAGNLAAAAGRDVDGPRDRAREDAFYRLGQVYAVWLAALSPADSAADAAARWQREVRTVLLPLGEDLVSSAGEAAWVGREARGRHLDSSLAWAWFHAGLRKALPLAYPDRPATSKEEDHD